MGKVLHASKSGYFPRCLVDSAGLPSDNNYIIGGIEAVMTPFWKVRKWEISITGTFTQGEEETNFDGRTNEVFAYPPVEKEEDLVCFNSSDKFFIEFQTNGLVSWGTKTLGEDTAPFETIGNLFVGLGHLFPPYNTFESNGIVKNDDIYKLPFFWGIQIFPLLSDDLGLGWVPVGTYTFDVLGVSTTPRTLYGPSDQSGSAAAVVSAKEYWSYGGTWNTSTGEPL